MIEYLELRLKEEHAARLLEAGEGKRLGSSVRKVRLRTDDPRLDRIRRIQQELSARGQFAYAGWSYHRKYEAKELDAAPLLQVRAAAVFEPPGEECGTIYDNADACPACGVGRRQISPLRLDLRRLPRSRDFACSIAGEWVVSQRAASALLHHKLSGFELSPVEHLARRRDEPVDLERVPSGRKLLLRAEDEGLRRGSWQFQVWLNQEAQAAEVRQAMFEARRLADDSTAGRSPEWRAWYHLTVTAEPLEFAEGTRCGMDPFDPDAGNTYVCPFGHTCGLNLLSEVWVRSGLPGGVDLAFSAQAVGVRRGLLVPTPVLLASQRLRRAVAAGGLTGVIFEPVHVREL